MKTKKLMALLMAMVMLLGCLAACSTPDNGTTTKAPNKESTGAANEGATDAPTEEPTTEEQSLFNGPGELPIVNEPVTLKVLTQHKTSNGANASTAGVWEWLEKQTGIHFEVESYTLEELASKIPLIMSTPDQMPDLFLYANINDADIVQYGQNGQLLQLVILAGLRIFAPSADLMKSGDFGEYPATCPRIPALPQGRSVN